MHKATQVLLVTTVVSVLCVSSAFAKSLPDSSLRVRRTASDQRIAELQALIALSNGGSGLIAHGQVDPFSAGKRKRSRYDGVPEDQRQYQLLEEILALMNRS